jgi:hypothetical protein
MRELLTVEHAGAVHVATLAQQDGTAKIELADTLRLARDQPLVVRLAIEYDSVPQAAGGDRGIVITIVMPDILANAGGRLPTPRRRSRPRVAPTIG